MAATGIPNQAQAAEFTRVKVLLERKTLLELADDRHDDLPNENYANVHTIG
jgi:hypothetical protein